MGDAIIDLFLVMSAALGLLAVVILWAVILIVAGETIYDLFRGEKEEDDELR